MRAIRIPAAARATCACLAVLLVAGSAQAQVQGRILTSENKVVEGAIRWKAIAKKYMVTTKVGATDVELEFAPAQVQKIEVATPRELKPAIDAVAAGKFAAAIPVLDKVAVDYSMLQWDEVATKALAEAHLLNGDPASAVKACERVTANRPEAAYLGDMAVQYWQALLKTGKTAKLQDYLDEAVKSGNREASAYALILRGDILMEKKQPRDALKDGYLRVIVLYENLRALQPEALYKAAKAFDALQQVPNAEKMRQKLRAEYGSSDFAKKP